MYKFFVPTPATLDELKSQYRKLAMLHHPDRGGDTATMQAINNEHDELFHILQNGWNQTHCFHCGASGGALGGRWTENT